jgi:hypothetical protein
MCLLLASTQIQAQEKNFWQSLVAGDPHLRSWRKQLAFQDDMCKEMERKRSPLLDGFNLNMGVALSGKLGVLAMGGQSTLDLFWNRLPQETAQPLSEELQEDGEQGVMQEYMILQDMVREQALAQGMDEEKARSLDIAGVFQYVQQLKEWQRKLPNAPVGWRFDRLAVEFQISFSMVPGTVFVVVGGDARIRLVWSLPKPNIKQAGEEIHSKALAEIQQHGFKLDYIRLGLTALVDGSLGVVDIGTESTIYAWLVPESDKPVLPDLSFLKHKKWKRGMDKAFKKTARWTKRAQDYTKRKPGRTWRLKMIRPAFEFSLSGDVQILAVGAMPNIEFNFSNTNWPHSPKKAKVATGQEAQQVRLSGLRLRLRPRAGVALGPMLKAELRPVVEWHLKR